MKYTNNGSKYSVSDDKGGTAIFDATEIAYVDSSTVLGDTLVIKIGFGYEEYSAKVTIVTTKNSRNAKKLLAELEAVFMSK